MDHIKTQASLDSTFHTIEAVPATIGRYETIAELGHGSMGRVYQAYDRFADRQVAIKVAHPQFVNQEDSGIRFRKLFFNEAHAAGVLDHPGIVSLYDAGIDGDLCYLVMELVPDARTLEVFCKSDNLLPVREVVGIIFKCAKALDYAHRQGIIHRDIKPSNILVSGSRDIKISDFSIARINRVDQTSTQFEGFMGSPLYMSPEQINEWDINTNSDIFSLGTVMYEMLTGAHPFKADTLTAIAHNITHENPVPLKEYRPDIPEGLEYILARMMKKKNTRRYASGRDLAADFTLIFDDLEKMESEDSIREKFESLDGIGFFKEFNDAEIWSLVRASHWDTYSPGQAIIREGDADNSFYIILSGQVQILKNDRLIETLGEGDCFGEMGFLYSTERTATVKAKTDVSLIRVNKSTLNLAEESTQLRFLKVFVDVVIERLKQTTTALTGLGK